MPVPTLITELSVTAASNSPAGTDTPVDGDNFIRAHGAFIAQLRDMLNGVTSASTLASPVISGTPVISSAAVTWSGSPTHSGAHTWSGIQTFSVTPAGKVTSGTYTPSYSNVANVATVVDNPLCQYLRVGDVVTVSGQVTIALAAATTTRLGITLPIASALTTASQVSGVGGALTDSIVTDITADTTNDRAELRYVAANTTTDTLKFHFTYLVV